MSESTSYDIPAEFARRAHLDAEQFQAMYEQSVS